MISRRLYLGLTVAVPVLTILLLWSFRPPAKVRELTPVISEMKEMRKRTGDYPVDPSTLSSVEELSKTYQLYFGDVSENGLTWSAFEVSGHDFTILSNGKELVIFMPTGRIKMRSFSSFPVYRFGSDTQKWEKGRIHWSLVATYWDRD